MKRPTRYAIIVGIVSFITHFIFPGYPGKVIFDETYFGQFVSSYFTHTYYFDIHPPFAKLLIALGGLIGGYTPGFSFASIGMDYPNAGYLALRLIPMLAGALLPLVIYAIVRELDRDDDIALLAGLMVAFENSLITQSRAILMDSILVLAGFAAIYFFLRWWNHGKWQNLYLTGILAACSLATKWVGASYLGLAMLFFFLRWIGVLPHRLVFRDRHWRSFLGGFLALIVVPAAIYVSIFAIHFSLLTKTGVGDGFQSPAFQATLSGNVYANDTSVTPSNFIQKFIEANKTMYEFAKNVSSHPYASKWYEWPFMVKPILYLSTEGQPGPQYVVYFVGNPVLWMCGLLAVVIGMFAAAVAAIRRRLNSAFLFVIVGYLANFIPFIFISRVMFLYHYSAALIFSLIIFMFELHWLFKWLTPKTRKVVIGLLLALTVISFALVAPFTYGIPIPYSYLHFFAPFLHDNW